MLLLMVASDCSAGRRRSNRPDLGSLGIGVSLLLFASLLFANTYSHARAGELMHYKHGVFTPAQGYIASGLLVVGGAVMIITALRPRRRDAKDSDATPTI